MAAGIVVRGAIAAVKTGAKALAKAVAKKKKPMARKATQAEYDAKMASRGKMTDKANKERMDKLTKPSEIKEASMKDKKKFIKASKPKSK